MEAPIPITPQSYEKEEPVINLVHFELKYKEIKYNCELNRIGNNKIEFVIFNEKNNCNKYKNQFSLQDFASINKYFKMFESLKELSDDLIAIINDKKIEIEKCTNDNIILKINVMTRNNNIVNINLKKSELNQKEKYDYILDEISKLKKLNEAKDIKINILESKIEELEKKYSELMNYINEKLINHMNEKKTHYIDEKMEAFKNSSKILNYNSEIFNNDSEIEFILSNIKGEPKSLSLLYSSKISGENEEKFKSCYIDKNDILILIKTKKNKRFGGYAHESFLVKEFKKNDSIAFLFNLNKKKYMNQKIINIQFGERVIFLIQ